MNPELEQLIICQCGCGKTRPAKDKRSRLRKFIWGHDTKGENNFQWKGDEIGYSSLHTWVRNHLPMPLRCQICDEIEPLELVNVTGKYTRDFNNWAYDCHRCHFIAHHTIDMSNRKCSECGSNTTYMNKRKNSRPDWRYSKLTGGLLCGKCYKKECYGRLKI